MGSIGRNDDVPSSTPDVSVTEPGPVTTDVRNESFFVQPFIGLLIAPTPRLLSISYIELDFDANGSTVRRKLRMVRSFSTESYATRLCCTWTLRSDTGFWIVEMKNRPHGHSTGI